MATVVAKPKQSSLRLEDRISAVGLRLIFATAIVSLMFVGVVACEDDAPASQATAHTSNLKAPDVVHMGEAPYGITVPYRVVLENTSGSALRIDRMSSSCACTTVAKPPITIAAGEEFVLAGLVALPDSLEFHQTSSVLMIGTADNENHSVTLTTDLVKPFPAAIAFRDDGTAELPLHPLYDGLIQSLDCYADGSDEPLADKTMDGIYVLSAPDSVPTFIDAVFTIEDQSTKGPKTLLQTIEIVPPDGTHVDGLGGRSSSTPTTG